MFLPWFLHGRLHLPKAELSVSAEVHYACNYYAKNSRIGDMRDCAPELGSRTQPVFVCMESTCSHTFSAFVAVIRRRFLFVITTSAASQSKRLQAYATYLSHDQLRQESCHSNPSSTGSCRGDGLFSMHPR